MESFLSELGEFRTKTIGIIVPHFGNIPAFHKAWQITARENPTVDFFVFTDCEIEENGNIHVVSCSFSELKELVQKCLVPYFARRPV